MMPGGTVWASDIWTSGAVLREVGALTLRRGWRCRCAGEQGCMRLSGPPESYGGMLLFQKASQIGNTPGKRNGPEGVPQ